MTEGASSSSITRTKIVPSMFACDFPLVPVTVDVSSASARVVDSFLWSLSMEAANMTVDEFAYTTCVDRGLPQSFQVQMALQLREQLKAHADLLALCKALETAESELSGTISGLRKNKPTPAADGMIGRAVELEPATGAENDMYDDDDDDADDYDDSADEEYDDDEYDDQADDADAADPDRCVPPHTHSTSPGTGRVRQLVLCLFCSTTLL